MIGQVIDSQFLRVLDYPIAAALSFILLRDHPGARGRATSAGPAPRSWSEMALAPTAPLVIVVAILVTGLHPAPQPRRHPLLVQQAQRPLQLPRGTSSPSTPGRNLCGARASATRSALSLQIGVIASVVATVLGTMVAFALGRYRFRGRRGTNLLIFMPMATPEVVMGSSLLTLFVDDRHPDGAHDDPHRAHHVLLSLRRSSRSRPASPPWTRGSSRRPPTSTPTSCRPSSG